jgi:hypothetical protein
LVIFLGLVAAAGLDHTAARAEPPGWVIAIIAIISAHTAGDVGLAISAALLAATRVARVTAAEPVALVAAAARAPHNLVHLAFQAVAGGLFLGVPICLTPGARMRREEERRHSLGVCGCGQSHCVPAVAAG